MKEMPPIDWRGLIQAPITRGLLLSAALHLALLTLIHPAPGSGKARMVMINARLELGEPAPPKATPALVEPAAKSAEVKREASEATVLASSAPVPTAVPTAMPAASRPEIAPEAPSPSAPAEPAPDVPAGHDGAASSGIGPSAPSSLPSVPLGIDTTWYLARQVDGFPKSIGRIEPVYPEEARRRNLQGSLKLMLKIDDLGRVQEAEVVEAAPPGIFDAAALDAFRNARFTPAMRDGRPVRYQAYIRVDFRLEKE